MSHKDIRIIDTNRPARVPKHLMKVTKTISTCKVSGIPDVRTAATLNAPKTRQLPVEPEAKTITGAWITKNTELDSKIYVLEHSHNFVIYVPADIQQGKAAQVKAMIVEEFIKQYIEEKT